MTRRLLAVAMLLAFGAASASAQWQLDGAALVGRSEHRVDAGFGVGASTGTTLGAEARVRMGSTLEFDARALGGTLTADSLARDDRSFGELGVRASVLPMHWLALQASATIRTYDLAPARQRWTQLGAGAELRMDFAGGNVRSLVRATLLPHVAVSGLSAPDFGIAGAAGLNASYGRLVGGVEYSVERYAFPPDALNVQRREQLAGLLVRLGAHW